MLDGKTRAVYKDEFLKLIFINRNIFFLMKIALLAGLVLLVVVGEESGSENADGSTRYH